MLAPLVGMIVHHLCDGLTWIVIGPFDPITFIARHFFPFVDATMVDANSCYELVVCFRALSVVLFSSFRPLQPFWGLMTCIVMFDCPLLGYI